jgi:lysophospholipase L1-like esterase
MTAVGTIGFSLYVKKGDKWYFVNSSKINRAEYELDLVRDINNKEYTYRLYFPLYQALIDLSIGVENNAPFDFVIDEMESMIIYGTSISQGGCATRPGMDYGAILGRMKNLNVINLGFSGSCKVEPEMLSIINNIIKEKNVKYILFELESNSPSYDHFRERFSHYMENLYNRENIKVYLVSHYDEGAILINDKLNKYRKGFYKVQKEIANKYGITFIDGKKITKKMECDGSVDGSHLTDLGFYEVAKQLAKIIK